MGKRMNFFFDKDADILYVSMGRRRHAISKEIGDDILIRINPETQEVIGFTILNLTTRFKKMGEARPLPITGELSLKAI